jgi:DNA polymerase-3 subunit beta
MENIVRFKPQWLKAAALIAATNDIRYYLNGVLVEVLNQEARLVATDGHRMAIFRKQVEGALPGRFIVPTQIIEMFKTDVKSKLEVVFEYDPNNPAARVTLDYKGVAIQFNPIDGKYPTYEQTMNTAAKPNGKVGTFNPDYISDLKRCAQTAFGASIYAPSVWHNGEGPAGVTYQGRDDFFGIVMPMRMGDTFNPPKWTLPAPEEKKQPEEALAA